MAEVAFFPRRELEETSEDGWGCCCRCSCCDGATGSGLLLKRAFFDLRGGGASALPGGEGSLADAVVGALRFRDDSCEREVDGDGIEDGSSSVAMAVAVVAVADGFVASLAEERVTLDVMSDVGMRPCSNYWDGDDDDDDDNDDDDDGERRSM